jgi:hypothetical protein
MAEVRLSASVLPDAVKCTLLCQAVPSEVPQGEPGSHDTVGSQSGSKHTDETSFRQPVLCNVAVQLHGCSDITKARSVHYILSA